MDPVSGVILAVGVPLTVAVAALGCWLRRRTARKPAQHEPPAPEWLADGHLPEEQADNAEAPYGDSVGLDLFLFDAAQNTNSSPTDASADPDAQVGADGVLYGELVDDVFAEGLDAPGRANDDAQGDEPMPVAQSAADDDLIWADLGYVHIATATVYGDADQLLEEGTARWDDMDYDGALNSLEFALQAARNRNDEQAEARALEQLAQFQFRAGEYACAVGYMTSLLRAAPTIGMAGSRISDLMFEHERISCFRDAAAEVLRLDGEAQRVRYEDEEAALQCALDAVAHAREHLCRDHWLVAHALCTLGCIHYDRGMKAEAFDAWDDADTILTEWPHKAQHLAKTVEDNLRLYRRSLGI